MFVVAAALGLLSAGCGSAGPAASGGSDPSGSGPSTSQSPPTTFGPIAPPPAEVLDATVVYFDADGGDRQPASPPPAVIADAGALDAFVQRYVDGDPPLGAAARHALDDGQVLIGAAVSSGCFPATGALLAFTAADVRLLPVGLPADDPDIECVRAITSVALVAIDAQALPAGLPIRGN
ncbi:MAG: hypothetical protein ABW219_07585 [Ilumatobacteraceae bacterium]